VEREEPEVTHVGEAALFVIALGPLFSLVIVVAGLGLLAQQWRMLKKSNHHAEIGRDHVKVVLPSSVVLIVSGMAALYLFTVNRDIVVPLREYRQFADACSDMRGTVVIKAADGRGQRDELELLVRTINLVASSEDIGTVDPKLWPRVVTALRSDPSLREAMKFVLAERVFAKEDLEEYCLNTRSIREDRKSREIEDFMSLKFQG